MTATFLRIPNPTTFSTLSQTFSFISSLVTKERAHRESRAYFSPPPQFLLLRRSSRRRRHLVVLVPINFQLITRRPLDREMGIVGLEERENIELQEFCRLLVASAGLHPNDKRFNSASNNNDLDDEEDRLVCVTSGVSFLGLAVVNCLLLRGYSVRIIVDHPEDVDKLREMRTSTNNSNISAVMAKLSDVETLTQAFDGCRGVFHTSAFADPAGLSGYTKSMAEIEMRVSQNVMEACAMAPSVRKCVLTSSLLACVWRDNTQSDHSPVINHHCWSNESICTDKKLWYALGKLKAEKAAWRIAEEKGIKLATICPGLITGPEFCTRSPTPTIAYLKGAQEMYQSGVLATVDMVRLAEAHVSVFEAMKTTAFGRYICFDRVIEEEHEAEKLAEETSLCKDKIIGNGDIDTHPRYQLSKRKLTDLLSRTLRFCYNQNQEYYN